MKMIHDSLERVMKATANSDRVSLNHKELHHKYICRLTCAEGSNMPVEKAEKTLKISLYNRKPFRTEAGDPNRYSRETIKVLQLLLEAIIDQEESRYVTELEHHIYLTLICREEASLCCSCTSS